MKKILLTATLLLCIEFAFGQIANMLDSMTVDAIGLSMGSNGRVNQVEAFNKMYKIAQMGYPKAMNALGRMYMDAQGCTLDTVAGLDWLNKAGEAGYAKAWHNLGMIYKYGRSGVGQDLMLAFFYMEKAAQQKEPVGLYDAGYMLFKGLGCAQDYTKAVLYLHQAANLNFAPAMYLLGICYRNGYGINRDKGEAGFWLSMASKYGYTFAIDELATEEPESTPNRVKLRSATVLSIPETIPQISSLENLVIQHIDGEYEGVLVTYDWSGKVIIKESPFSLTFQSIGKDIVAEWREQGADTVQVKAIWKDSRLVFTEATQGRSGHYNSNERAIWTFTEANLQILKEGSNSYLVGIVQMYSPETMEPHQPVYLNLKKVFSLKDETNLDSKKESFSVYPNPFQEGLTINFYQPHESEVKVAVYDTKGVCHHFLSLGKFAEGQQSSTIKFYLNSGAYVFKIFAGDKEYQTVLIKK